MFDSQDSEDLNMSFDVVSLRFSDEKLAKTLTRIQESPSANSDGGFPVERLTHLKLRNKVAEIVARKERTP